jgi:hypothetical protein
MPLQTDAGNILKALHDGSAVKNQHPDRRLSEQKRERIGGDRQ